MSRYKHGFFQENAPIAAPSTRIGRICWPKMEQFCGNWGEVAPTLAPALTRSFEAVKKCLRNSTISRKGAKPQRREKLRVDFAKGRQVLI
jgi:hypothetical protein